MEPLEVTMTVTCVEPLVGSLRVAREPESPFTGWVGLAVALGERLAVAEARGLREPS